MRIRFTEARGYKTPYLTTITAGVSTRVSGARGHSPARKVGSIVVNVFLLLAVTAGMFVGVNGFQKASADTYNSPFAFVCNLGSEGPTGEEGMWLTAPAPVVFGPMSGTPQGGQQTAYEKYGMSGTTFSVYRGPENSSKADADVWNWDTDKFADSAFFDSVKRCTMAPEVANAAAANTIGAVSKLAVWGSNTLYESATSVGSSLTAQMTPAVERIVASLQKTLYFPFLELIVMLAALYMGWIGLVKKQSSRAFRSAIWIVGAAAVGGVMMADPMGIARVGNAVVSTVGAATSTQIQSASAGLASDRDGYLCEAGSGTDPRTLSREFQCTMWYSFIYVPWAQGQFGVTDMGDPKLTQHLHTIYDNGGQGSAGTSSSTMKSFVESKKIKNANADALNDLRPHLGTTVVPEQKASWALYQLEQQVDTGDGVSRADKSRRFAMIPRAQLGLPAAHVTYTNDSGVQVAGVPNEAWKGDGGGGLLGTSLGVLIASLCVSALILMLGFGILVAEIAALFLLTIAPLFLLIGVHPGAGRRIAMTWLETLASLYVRRIVLSVILGVTATMLAVAMATPLVTFAKLMLLVAIAGAAMKMNTQIMSMVTRNIRFGGHGAVEAPISAEAAVGKSLRVVGGLAGGGVAGAVGYRKALTATAAGVASGGNPVAVGAALASKDGKTAKNAGNYNSLRQQRATSEKATPVAAVVSAAVPAAAGASPSVTSAASSMSGAVTAPVQAAKGGTVLRSVPSVELPKPTPEVAEKDIAPAARVAAVAPPADSAPVRREGLASLTTVIAPKEAAAHGRANDAFVQVQKRSTAARAGKTSTGAAALRSGVSGALAGARAAVRGGSLIDSARAGRFAGSRGSERVQKRSAADQQAWERYEKSLSALGRATTADRRERAVERRAEAVAAMSARDRALVARYERTSLAAERIKSAREREGIAPEPISTPPVSTAKAASLPKPSKAKKQQQKSEQAPVSLPTPVRKRTAPTPPTTAGPSLPRPTSTRTAGAHR